MKKGKPEQGAIPAEMYYNDEESVAYNQKYA
jgi:hypothetical protein